MLTKSRHWYAIKRSIPPQLHQPLLLGYYKVRSVLYRGNAVHCPICEKSFSAFVKGHICPSCGSGKRHRLMYLFLRDKTNFFTEKLKVLHFAPEHCFYKRFAALPNLDYISADLDSPRAMQKIDMTNIPYPDNTFDVVISSHVLEHVPDDRKAMQELQRVLKPGGWAIHQAPIDYTREQTFEDATIVTNEGRLQHFGHIDHKRVYGKDYYRRMESAGFIVTKHLFIGSFPANEIARYGLDSTEIICYCEKNEAAAPNGPAEWQDWSIIDYSEKPFV
jgi:SAM-dependent methyltransferase